LGTLRFALRFKLLIAKPKSLLELSPLLFPVQPLLFTLLFPA
jgi:hypothetical protein